MVQRNKLALGILAAIICLLLIFQTPLLRSLRGQFWHIWILIISQTFNIGPLTVPNNVADQLRRLTAENHRLRSELKDLEDIKKQVGIITYADFQRIDARVVAEPIDTFRSQYLVNKGTRDGLILGAPAVILDSVLVGFISELNETSAILQLTTHPATTFPGKITADEKSTQGIINGHSYTSIEMTTVPRDIALVPDLAVTTVAQDKIVPGGLLIGTIDTIKTEAHDPYQQARLSLPYDKIDLKAVSFLVAL